MLDPEIQNTKVPTFDLIKKLKETGFWKKELFPVRANFGIVFENVVSNYTNSSKRFLAKNCPDKKFPKKKWFLNFLLIF